MDTCGFPLAYDHFQGSPWVWPRSDRPVMLYGYAGGRWDRGDLTYSVDLAGSDLFPGFANATIAAAFNEWQTHAPFFTFRPVPTDGDIHISWASPTYVEHSPRWPYDELLAGRYPSGYAIMPTDGRIRFSVERAFGPLPAAGGGTFSWFPAFMLHEIGHTLGLKHSADPSSIMYPKISPNKTVLDPGTIEAIQRMYCWAPQTPIPDHASENSPSLAVAGDWTPAGGGRPRLYMAWRGIPGDSDIYWSVFDNDRWSPQENIPGGGFASLHGPALLGFPTIGPSAGPNTGLFMAWDGVRGDDAIYYAANPRLSHWEPQRRTDFGTSDRPALAHFRDRIYMAWKGVGRESTIFYSTFAEDTGWTPQVPLPGRGTSAGPALATWQRRLYMFWRGVGEESNVYFAWLGDEPNATWQPQQLVAYWTSRPVEHIPIGTGHRPTATLRDDDTIVLSWRGTGRDTRLWFASLEGGEDWTGQVRVPGVASAAGPAVAALPGTMQNGQRVPGPVFLAWRGIIGDTNLYFSRLG